MVHCVRILRYKLYLANTTIQWNNLNFPKLQSDLFGREWLILLLVLISHSSEIKVEYILQNHHKSIIGPTLEPSSAKSSQVPTSPHKSPQVTQETRVNQSGPSIFPSTVYKWLRRLVRFQKLNVHICRPPLCRPRSSRRRWARRLPESGPYWRQWEDTSCRRLHLLRSPASSWLSPSYS